MSRLSLQRKDTAWFAAQHVQCSYCGTAEGKTLRKREPYRMIRCTHCNFVYLNPRPLEEELKKYYQHSYLPQGPSEIQRWSKMMNRVFDNAADHIERYGTKGAILDVGCGFGFFLHHMKQKGWEVAGLELSLSGIHYAREELKISVVDTPFEQADLPKEYFDVITLFYVIEHTYDPLSFLKKIHTLLKPRGIIFLRYPHTTFVERLLTSLGIENNLYDIPFHLSDFTPLTIERFLIKAGFSNCEHFIGGYTLPQKFSHKMSSVIFGFLAEAVFQLSFKVCLLPGVSKSIIAQKNSH